MKKSIYQASPRLGALAAAILVLLVYVLWERLFPAQTETLEGLHPLAAKFIDAEAPVKTSNHFTIYGTGAEADEVMRRAEHAWFASNERGLRGFDPDTKGHIALFTRETWQKFAGLGEHEPSRRSGQIGRTILLVREPGLEPEMSDVAHEVIHFRLEDADLPLWFEEGLAMQLGIEITLAFEQLLDRRAAEDPEPEIARRMTDHSIMDFSAYPEDPILLAGYYRHCRLFFKALDLDKTQLHELALALGELRGWYPVLVEQLELSDEELEALKQIARITVPAE